VADELSFVVALVTAASQLADALSYLFYEDRHAVGAHDLGPAIDNDVCPDLDALTKRLTTMLLKAQRDATPWPSDADEAHVGYCRRKRDLLELLVRVARPLPLPWLNGQKPNLAPWFEIVNGRAEARLMLDGELLGTLHAYADHPKVVPAHEAADLTGEGCGVLYKRWRDAVRAVVGDAYLEQFRG
jgi:hypothetical protein